jgi:hypothetical protein
MELWLDDAEKWSLVAAQSQKQTLSDWRLQAHLEQAPSRTFTR